MDRVRSFSLLEPWVLQMHFVQHSYIYDHNQVQPLLR